jgi:serine O-acetyltransferase
MMQVTYRFQPPTALSIPCFYIGVSRLLSERGKKLEADKVYQLNKMMSGCDLFHEVKLPLRTYCDHPFGAVIGRGIIGENFYFSHGCTIGNNKNIFPISEGFLVMLPGSKLVGKSTLGSHVVLSGGSYVKDENIPSFSVVFGSTPNLKSKELQRNNSVNTRHSW